MYFSPQQRRCSFISFNPLSLFHAKSKNELKSVTASPLRTFHIFNVTHVKSHSNLSCIHKVAPKNVLNHNPMVHSDNCCFHKTFNKLNYFICQIKNEKLLSHTRDHDNLISNLIHQAKKKIII